jgi:putative ABC transport system ATP-binding protein
MSAIGETVLACQGVRHVWPDGTRLPDFPDFRLGRGERLFLRGASGSGKSTLLHLIAGGLVPRAGRIAVAGQAISALGARARDRARADHIGLIFQQFNLLPYLSVLDNVLLPCRFSARRRARALARDPDLTAAATRLLDALDLAPSLRARDVSALSVGQQQRVAAARALIGAPELILADEPTSALDDDARRRFLDLLFAECAAAESALLLVSHDANLAEFFPRQLHLIAERAA